MTFAHIFDIAAACVLAFCIVRGVMRGLTGEIVSLLGLVASVVCAWTFAQPAADAVLGYFPTWDKTITELGCSLAIFIGVSLLFSIVGKLMRAIVKAANLSLLDHTLGLFSGAARAFLVVLFIYGAVSIFSPVVPSEWMKDSIAMQGAATVWPPVLGFLTEKGWIKLDHLTPETVERRTVETLTLALPSAAGETLPPASMPAIPGLESADRR